MKKRTPLVHGGVGAEDSSGLLEVPVEVRQPRVRRALVVGAVEPPVVGDHEVVDEVEQQLVGRHHAPGEEAARHPRALERVRVVGVREHMDEGGAVGLEPAGDVREQRAPVPHVLEHLDRDHPIEASARLEGVDIGGHDLDACKPERVDVRLLGRGVRDREDAT